MTATKLTHTRLKQTLEVLAPSWKLDYTDGPCGTFALGLSEALNTFGVTNHLMVLWRDTSSRSHLSHVVVMALGHTYDVDGSDAEERWVDWDWGGSEFTRSLTTAAWLWTPRAVRAVQVAPTVSAVRHVADRIHRTLMRGRVRPISK